MRLFTALALPEPVRATLCGIMSGVPGARWQKEAQLHLTLRFIGEADGAMAAEIDEMLAAISAPGFEIDVCSVGVFGGRTPRSLWAGVAPCPALTYLNRKIESALQRAGCAPDTRKFSPHITLARMKAPPPDKLADYLSAHALIHAGRFLVTEFTLFSSQLTPSGSLYRAEASYPLRG